MMTMAITPNHHIASILSSSFYAIWNIFSGFIVPQTVIFCMPTYIDDAHIHTHKMQL